MLGGEEGIDVPAKLGVIKLAFDHAGAHFGIVWIQDVRPVACRGHPARYDVGCSELGLRCRSNLEDILADVVFCRMLERIVLKHVHRVRLR